MMKKFLSITLAIALILTSMLGLTTASASEFDVGYDGSEVTISFYHAMGKDKLPLLDSYIEDFNVLYPNIHITYTAVGGYDDVRDQISKEIPEGLQPNIAYCYPDHIAMYNLADAVQTLDELIASKTVVNRADGTTEVLGLTDEQIADFIPGYYAEGAVFGDGKMYSLPFSKSTEVLYYNKTFFEANNIPVPTTWDEMEQVCAQIKAINENCIPLGYDSSANWFITMCEQLKSPYTSLEDPYFLFDNETNRAFVRRFNEWYQKGYLTTQGLYGGYTSGLFVNTTGTNSYMSIGSSAGATHQCPAVNTDGSYPFEVGIATIPQADPNNKKVISQGPSLCIFKKDNPQEVIASWLFMEYLTTNADVQADFSVQTGYVPSIKSVSEHPFYQAEAAKADGNAHIAMLSAKVCMEQADAYYTSPAFVGSSMAREQVGNIIDAALKAGDSIEDEIDSIFEDAMEECEFAIW